MDFLVLKIEKTQATPALYFNYSLQNKGVLTLWNSIKHFQKNNESQLLIKTFFKQIGLSQIVHQINIKRHTLISPLKLIKWLISTIFARQSLYRAQPAIDFTTRTVRNFLNDGRINWQKLTCLMASQVIKVLRPCIDSRRRLALIIDDSLFARPYTKQTELVARVYDHDKRKYLRGYRVLTLGWSNANTFLPVNFALMSSHKQKNILGLNPKFDRRTLAGCRRDQARSKMSIVAINLVRQAIKNHLPAQYVLFDSWYSSPKMFRQIKQLGLDGVGMLKNGLRSLIIVIGDAYTL